MADATWQDEHQRLCVAFCHAASDASCTWERWRDAWQAAEDCKSTALGVRPRRASREAYKARNTQSAIKASVPSLPRKTGSRAKEEAAGGGAASGEG